MSAIPSLFRAGSIAVAAGITLLVTVLGCGETTTDAAPPDASSDAPEAGARRTVDAGASPRFCAAASHDFCADFDGDDPHEGWAQVSPDGDEIEAIDSDRSPPYALFIHGPGGKTGGFEGGWLLAKLQEPTKNIRYTADVRIDEGTELDDENGVTVMSVGALDPNSDTTHIVIAALRLGKTKNVLYLTDIGSDAGQGGMQPTTLTRPFPIDAWIHVELTLETRNDGTIAVSVLLDGAHAGGGTLSAGSLTVGDMNFSLGGSRRGDVDTPAGPFSGRFDNVTIDLD